MYQNQLNQQISNRLSQNFTGQTGSYQQQQFQQPQQQFQQQAQQQAQQLAQQQAQDLLPEKDWGITVLTELKRVCGEYAIAVTESNDPSVRQVFTDLLNSSLKLQGQLYQQLKANNWYKAGAEAQGQEIAKQIQSFQQSGQQAFQFAKQKMGQQGQAADGAQSGSGSGLQQPVYM